MSTREGAAAAKNTRKTKSWRKLIYIRLFRAKGGYINI